MVLNNEHLLVIILGIGMLVLGGVVIFLLLHKKKSTHCKKCSSGIPFKGCFSTNGLNKWIEFSKSAKKYISNDDSTKKYNTFCQNPTNDNWIETFGVQGDPNTNGFYDFWKDCPKCPKCPKCTCPCGCESPNNFINSGGNINDFNNKCCDNSTKSLRTGSKNQDHDGYNDYCVKTIIPDIERNSLINCPTCAYSNKEWMNINRISDPDPNTNGYNDFCIYTTSSGSTLDWYNKVVPILPPLPKGAKGNDPKINGYNKFCGK